MKVIHQICLNPSMVFILLNLVVLYMETTGIAYVINKELEGVLM